MTSKPIAAIFHNERIKGDLMLLLAAVVWGSAFVAQRVAAVQLSPYLFNGARFLIGALLLLPLTRGRWHRFTTSHWLSAGLAGLLLFFGAALQQVGLQTTTASNAGFITGLYVVIIPLVLMVVWRQKPHPAVWLACGLALAGLFLLSTGGRLVLAEGDRLEFVGAFFWAFHVILIDRLVKRAPVLPLVIAQYLACAMLNLAAMAFLDSRGLDQLPQIGWTIVYTGVFSIGLGYTLQAVGQRTAPPTDAGLLLSGESVFAALFGWLLLDERLSAAQILGCILIFGGMVIAQLARSEPAATATAETGPA